VTRTDFDRWMVPCYAPAAFVPVRGEIPSPLAPPRGCHFHPRCPYAMPRCRESAPALAPVAPGRLSACFLNDTETAT